MNDKPNNTATSDTPADDNATVTSAQNTAEDNTSLPDNNSDALTTSTETDSHLIEENPAPEQPVANTEAETLEATEATEATEAIIVSEPQPTSEAIDIIETPTATTPPASTQNPKASKKGFWLLGTLIVIGWGTTAAAGYWGYQQALRYQTQNIDIQSALTTLKGELESQLSSDQQSQSNQLKALRQTVDGELKAVSREATTESQKLKLQIKEHEARLNGQQERLTGLSTTSREDWLLAEAEYLLKLANQRVLMERTPANAVALLTRADAIMERVSAGLGDRELFAIRKLLAEEITALRLIESVDTQGLYLKLGSLARAIEQLPTLPGKEERFSNSKKKEPMRETTWATFKREMDNVLSFLSNSFEMYPDTELANPIVSQQRLQLMQLNTRLLLEQAQISLLKEDTVSYQESLKAASELVNQYYFESPKRAAFAEEVIALAQKDIAPILPDISHSLKLLHSYIAEQHRLNAPSAGLNNSKTKGAR